MSTDKDLLLEMGFDSELIEQAIAATNNSGLQNALDWLEKHSENCSAEQQTTVEEQANSLQCDDCGKLLKSSDAAHLHAERTGHLNFSESKNEIKPLTEEEMKNKLEELKKKLEEKRLLRKAQEVAEQKEQEKLRRITGKEITAAKEKQKELEMKKAIELKKREQKEDKEYLQKLRAQIEEDKKARLEKLGKKSETPADQSPPVVITKPSTDYSEAKIQIRTQGKPPMTCSFKSDAPFSSVVEFLHQNGLAENSFNLSTTFPRRIFSTSDYQKTLKELDLVPSAVLMLVMK